MKIILTQDVENLGSLGDEVDVKPGYARNYLIPQGKATLITSAKVKQLNHQRTLLAKKRAEAIEASKSVAEKLEAAEVTFVVKASDSGKLFGSVTAKQIIDALAEQGIEIDRKDLILDAAIKTLGTTAVSVKLHSTVTGTVNVKVVADVEKTEAPAEEAEEAPAVEETEEAAE